MRTPKKKKIDMKTRCGPFDIALSLSLFLSLSLSRYKSLYIHLSLCHYLFNFEYSSKRPFSWNLAQPQ